MEENLNQKPEQSEQSENNTSDQKKGKTLSQLFKETPYSEDRIGQAFIISGVKPPSAMKDSSSASPDKSKEKAVKKKK